MTNMVGIVLIVACCLAAGIHAQKSKLMPDYLDHPCVRECQDGAEPMECRYRFVVESYQTMSRACYECAAGNFSDCSRDHCVHANGFSRNIKTVNRGIPGPTIQVCEGDTVIVDLENFYSMSEGVTIHWHGILQLFSPHMDGVGMITQCPIQAYTSFEYKFVAIDRGTHFWHAHTGLQRGEGMFGSLIVRQSPSREPHTGIYDFDLPEHVFVVNEWQNTPLIEIYTAFHHGDGPQRADSVMINGYSQDVTGNLELPRAVFKVEPGKRHRFRVINSGSLFCPIQISVDNHTLILIASDGREFEPFEVESFDTYSAERYDFILVADQPVDNYWLRAKGLGSCQSNNLEEQAIIEYVSEEIEENVLLKTPVSTRQETDQTTFNFVSPETSVPLGDTRDQILGMNALVPDDRSLTGNPDHQFIMFFALNSLDNLHFFDPDLYPAGQGPYRSVSSAQINRISNRLGPVSLLAQMDQVPQEMFCNSSSVGEECQTEWCECVHKLTVKKGEIVEMVLMGAGSTGFTHPFHLHGFSYRVVAMDRLSGQTISPELFREMDARGEISRKLSRAPFKDTVPIPNGGYVILRFEADNPGVWFAHCHLAFHAEIGMAFSLEVLDENGQLPPPPPNFPTCGPFVAPENLQSSQKDTHTSEAGKPNLQQSSGSGPQSSPASKAVVPQWVLPLVISMSVVIGGMALAIVQLWRKGKKMSSKEYKEYKPQAPTYNTQGESSREDNGLHGSDHFSYSKKQERVSLTR